jgi:hypothetical protein
MTMDNIDRYIEQVCRRVGGPRAMRAHLRQELREHLLDAVERLGAGGMDSQEAQAKAIEDFGSAEDVRGGLEEAHGQRLLPVIVEKALQWKETTMKARWLWMTSAHVMLASVLMLELVFVFGMMIFIMPKFREMEIKGWLTPHGAAEAGLIAWSSSFLGNLAALCALGGWILPAIAAAWVVYEWRVRSENKAWMRLSLMGVGSLALFVVAAIEAVAMIAPLMVAWPQH